MNELKEIIVLFKTHLDVGFTDLAENVVNDYITTYIPNAIRAAADLRAQGDRFTWTTGSWILSEYLKRCPDDAAFAEAVAQDDIRWHALPFTSHTELMDENLFNHGLNISKQLDARFGVTTRAAKMTDVPGHTRAMVPLMAKAGIRFLHIGVNAACPPPEVPPLFRWAAPTGESILVMYQSDYGEFQALGNSGTAICFAHTGDNNGPQNADHIAALYAKLRAEHPHANIHTGTLDDVADVVETLTDLPVVTQEIGDTWIHGTGSDPLKVSQYRAVLRACQQIPAADAAEVYQLLLPVPEHTWGLDEKSTLGHGLVGEHRYFVRTEFEEARKTAPFRRMEKSWVEQRRYVQNAIDCLRAKHPIIAEALLSGTTCSEVPVRGCCEGRANEPMPVGDYLVTVNENGAICKLERNGVILADAEHLWGAALYQAFSKADYDRFIEQYVTNTYDWALEDLSKIGCEAAIKESLNATPTLAGLWYDNDDLICELRFAGNAHDLYGAPEKLVLSWRFLQDEIHLDARWHNKPASRVAEAMWLGIETMGEIKSVRKLSEWIDVLDIVPKGNRRLHATDYGVRFDDGSEIETFDTALANIGAPAMLHFPTDAPRTDEGVFFNLHNNIYGTNFVMWYDEDARFRFTVHLAPNNK